MLPCWEAQCRREHSVAAGDMFKDLVKDIIGRLPGQGILTAFIGRFRFGIISSSLDYEFFRVSRSRCSVTLEDPLSQICGSRSTTWIPGGRGTTSNDLSTLTSIKLGGSRPYFPSSRPLTRLIWGAPWELCRINSDQCPHSHNVNDQVKSTRNDFGFIDTEILTRVIFQLKIPCSDEHVSRQGTGFSQFVTD